jgi:microcin C transport system permease protein
MTAYVIRRLLPVIPMPLGVRLISLIIIQFAPGGPIEHIMAQLTGTNSGADLHLGNFSREVQPSSDVRDR